ncbi:hypothetical protein QO259_18605 [Salinicola sp. JS01]|uniref:hypothetical protein n=1 Tax=Salinicola sp. JS01 TaxID=3050071 RepID=UPI00255B72A2|nr:hypothetical protein [Salinicola sp. JS01]WIX32789.1 hypothetical protein QO259_18605 [Salinicola sp. JS01]
MKTQIVSHLARVAAAVALAGFLPVLAQANDSIAQQEAMQRLHQPLNLQPAMMTANQFGDWRVDIGAGQSEASANALRAEQNRTGMTTMKALGRAQQSLIAEGQSAAQMDVVKRLYSVDPA